MDEGHLIRFAYSRFHFCADSVPSNLFYQLLNSQRFFIIIFHSATKNPQLGSAYKLTSRQAKYLVRLGNFTKLKRLQLPFTERISLQNIAVCSLVVVKNEKQLREEYTSEAFQRLAIKKFLKMWQDDN